MINIKFHFQILFSDPKFIDKGYIYEYLHPWLKTGLLTSTGKIFSQKIKLKYNTKPPFQRIILQEINGDEDEKS